MNLNHFEWTRQPKAYTVSDEKITVTTAPGTDLWQRTYYHFRNDNAPVSQMTTEDSSFTAEFTGMQLLPCQWKAHDGQKPNEDL